MLDGRIGVVANNEPWVEANDLPVRIYAPLVVDPLTVLPEWKRADWIAVSRWRWSRPGRRGPTPANPSSTRNGSGSSSARGIGGALTLLGQDDMLETVGIRKVAVLTIPMLMPNGPAAAVGLWAKARGGVHAPVSACASGAEGIAWAYKMIEDGEIDIAIAGGAEACIHPLPIAGFAADAGDEHRTHDPQGASRPFDIERDGFVLGEGAGIMVLERADHARARGAKIYGRLAGIGMSNDAFHITAPEPDGEGSARAIAKALKSADLTKADIGHVNAHATSTPVGDLAESNTILRAIGDHPVVTATKSMTGHMLGAAGAVEGIATLLAIRDGVIPGTRNLNKLDPEIKVDVAADNREVELTAAVNDSFGFGGHNVALVFSKA